MKIKKLLYQIKPRCYKCPYRPKYHEGLVRSEISLPPNAPKEYADRATLWNVVELSEKGQKSQLYKLYNTNLHEKIEMQKAKEQNTKEQNAKE